MRVHSQRLERRFLHLLANISCGASSHSRSAETSRNVFESTFPVTAIQYTVALLVISSTHIRWWVFLPSLDSSLVNQTTLSLPRRFRFSSTKPQSSAVVRNISSRYIQVLSGPKCVSFITNRRLGPPRYGGISYMGPNTVKATSAWHCHSQDAVPAIRFESLP
jgi:hypothetical protein